MSLIASADSAGTVSDSPSVAVYPSLNTRYSTCSTARSRSSRSGPTGKSSTTRPNSLIVCLARLIRCAIVASGTPNAAAICAVDSPPTARSVSAI